MIIALDLSLRATGFSIFHDGKLVDCGCLPIPDRHMKPVSAQDTEDVDRLAKNIVNLIHCYNPKLIVFEDPAGSKSSRASQTLALAKGVFIGVCNALKITTIPVRAKQVKKELTGNCNAEKSELAAIIENKIPQFVDISNGWTKIQKEAAVDAIAIFLFYETIKGD